MEHTATISSKGQITLPAEIRRGLNLRPGDKITIVKRGGSAEIKPSTYDQELAELRARIEKEVKAKGLWGKPWEEVRAAAEAARTEYYRKKYGPRD
jgi:AbrB family looped-hinge helix DNA binding protein